MRKELALPTLMTRAYVDDIVAETQTQGYVEMWYQTSMADENQVKVGQQYEADICAF